MITEKNIVALEGIYSLVEVLKFSMSEIRPLIADSK